MAYQTLEDAFLRDSVAPFLRRAEITPPPAGATFCRVPACNALAFAEMRSPQLRLQVCFAHYEAAYELADELAAAVA